jgi:hypothetical protein
VVALRPCHVAMCDKTSGGLGGPSGGREFAGVRSWRYILLAADGFESVRVRCRGQLVGYVAFFGESRLRGESVRLFGTSSGLVPGTDNSL